MSLLLLLRFIIWYVDTDSKRSCLCAVLVLHQQGIFPRVGCGNSRDGDAGKLAMLKLQCVVLITHQRFFVLHPADLGNRITPHVASEVEGLKRERRDTMLGHIINKLIKKCDAHDWLYYLALLNGDYIGQAAYHTGTVYRYTNHLINCRFKKLFEMFCVHDEVNRNLFSLKKLTAFLAVWNIYLVIFITPIKQNNNSASEMLDWIACIACFGICTQRQSLTSLCYGRRPEEGKR